MARVTLFSDKHYWFSPGGSVVAYAVAGRNAVALGDPIGPAVDMPFAIQGFLAFCAGRDWRPAFWQTFPDHLRHYRRAGFQTLCVGREAILDLEAFSLAGKAFKAERNQLRRMEKQGLRAELLLPPHPPALLARLRAISEDWLQRRHGVEKRFSLGWFDEEYLAEDALVVVFGDGGEPLAFANRITQYRAPERSLDLMRARADAPPGVMDLIFLTLFAAAQEEGMATFNLGLAPLAGVGTRTDDPAAERAAHFLYEHMNRFYGFKGLHAYKSKFHPRWEPRFLIYPSAASLPSVAWAVVRANNGSAPLWTFLWGVGTGLRASAPKRQCRAERPKPGTQTL